MDVPALAPVTMPEEEPIVATPVLPLSHEPPDVASVSVADEPTHVLALPPMEGGAEVIVTIALPDKAVVPDGVVSLASV